MLCSGCTPYLQPPPALHELTTLQEHSWGLLKKSSNKLPSLLSSLWVQQHIPSPPIPFFPDHCCHCPYCLQVTRDGFVPLQLGCMWSEGWPETAVVVAAADRLPSAVTAHELEENTWGYQAGKRNLPATAVLAEP